jgi:hypothetical protein
MMDSQDKVLRNSPTLRGAKPFVLRKRKTGQPLLRELVIASFFPIETLTDQQPQNIKNTLSNFSP